MSDPDQNLVLIRHGESLAHDEGHLWLVPSDSAVSLTTRGIQQTAELHSGLDLFLQALSPSSVKFVSSPMLRSVQTMDIVRDHLARYPSSTRRWLQGGGRCPPGLHLEDLREFYSWVHPQEDLRWFSYGKFVQDSSYPGDKITQNVISWDSLTSRSLRLYELLRSVDPDSESEVTFVFSHHYTINSLIFAFLMDPENKEQLAAASRVDGRLARWCSLSPAQLSEATKLLNIRNSFPIHLTVDSSDLYTVWDLLASQFHLARTPGTIPYCL